MTVLLQPGKRETACFKLATSFAGVEIVLVVGLNLANSFRFSASGAHPREAGIVSQLFSVFLPPDRLLSLFSFSVYVYIDAHW